jgi:predicted MFS family arabinose efflux permease
MAIADTPPTSRRLGTPPIFVMGVAAGVAVANIYYNQPMLGLIESDLTGALTGFVPMAAQLGYALGLILLVPLGDLVERRRLIVWQFVALGAALSLAATAQSSMMILLASLFVGAGATAAQQIVPFAALLTTAQSRGATVGAVMAGLITGIFVSRPLAGYVAAYAGWRAVFWLGVPLALAMAALLAVRLPRSRSDNRQSYGRLLASLATLWRDLPTLRLAAMTQAMIFAAFMVFWTVLAFRLQDPPFGYGADVVGLFGILGIVGVLAAPVAGVLSDRRGPYSTIMLGAILTLLSWIILGTWESLIGFSIAIALLDFGMQAAIVANQHVIFALRPEAYSRINTLFMGLTFIGGAFGSALASLGWQMAGWPAVSGIGLALGVAAVTLQTAGVLSRRRSRHE